MKNLSGSNGVTGIPADKTSQSKIPSVVPEYGCMVKQIGPSCEVKQETVKPVGGVD